jgi:DNA-binding transcriptional MerR regulator
MPRMRIGELSDAVGLSPSTIRYYEKVGLVPPPARSLSGYRDYSEDDERRLRLIAQARLLSVPLDEVRQLVRYAVDGECGPLRAELLAALKRRAADTRRQVRELKALQAELDRACATLQEAECQSAPASGPAEKDSCTCLDDVTPSVPAGQRNGNTDSRKEESP